MIKFIMFFLSLVSAALASAVQNPDQNPQLFNYSVILNAQKNCNDDALSKIPFAMNRKSIFSLARNAIVVVSNLSLKEVSRNAKPIRGKTRDFVLKYTLYAQIACNNDPNIFEGGRGMSRTDLPVIEHAWHDPTHVEVVTDNVGDDIYKPSLIVQFTANDLPPAPGVNGLACIVTKKDFMTKTPAVLAEQICGKGALQTSVQKTIGAIRQAQSELRAGNNATK